MNIGRVFFLLAGAALSAAASAGTFDFKVERIRLSRNQSGNLHIDAKGIRFQSSDEKTVITIPFEDLRQADVANPKTLRFQMYAVDKWKPFARREYTFRTETAVPVEELAMFLTARLRRPVVGHYATSAKFQVPAYHRRTRSGSNGTLEIGDEAIRFVSEKPADSRTWLYRDIETIGRPNPYHFRVTTVRETYVVELRAQLPEDAYQLAWSKVYHFESSSK
jgi:hypothetical protein